jgi:DNA polymerase-3 subunit beta
MEQKIILAKSDLFAMSHLAAKKDIRFYLMGVCLELGRRESRLVATDGHILGVLRLADQVAPGIEETAQYIIPLDAVLKFKPKAKSAKDVVLTIEAAQEDGRQFAVLSDPYSGESYRFQMIDGRFPDYRRVLPKTVSNEPGQFDPDFLVRFKKVSVDLGSRRGLVTVSHNGRGDASCAALVTVDDPRFLGVLMPWRTEEPTMSAPGWAYEELSNTEEATEAA